MDDDIDIYEDLHNFNEQHNEQNVENYKKVVEECTELKKQVDELTEKTKDLQKINKTLEVNLSSLLKTAKAEIARKDRMIGELRKQVENVTFRKDHQARERIPNRSMEKTTDPNKQELRPIQPIVIKKELVMEPEVNNYVTNYKKKSNSYVESSKFASTTVFSERMRKRIKEEEDAEQKQKLLENQEKQKLIEDKEKQKIEKKHMEKSADNNKENSTGNGMGNKENQSHFNLQSSNKATTEEHFHCSYYDHLDNTNNNEESNVVNQQRSMLNKKFSIKRMEEDIEQPTSKRCKVETKSYSTQDSKRNAFFTDMKSEKQEKMLFKEEVHISYSEKEITAYHENHATRATSRSRTNDTFYSRKEYSKRSYEHGNYSKTKEISYHEKGKYSRSWVKSPDLKYYDRKNRYHTDRHKDNRERYENRKPFQGKERSPPNDFSKKHYNFHDRERQRTYEKYGNVDIDSRHQSQRSGCRGFRTSRSISRERSRSESRERSVHGTHDKKSSQSTNCNNNSENHRRKTNEMVELKNELQITTATPKKEIVENKSTKKHNSFLKDGEILDTLYDDVSDDENNEESVLIKVEFPVKQEKSEESDVNTNKVENPISPKQEEVASPEECIKNYKTDKDGNLQEKEDNNSKEIVQSNIDFIAPMKIMIKEEKNEDIINHEEPEIIINESVKEKNVLPQINEKILKEENLPDIVPKCHFINSKEDTSNSLNSASVELVETEVKKENDLPSSKSGSNEASKNANSQLHDDQLKKIKVPNTEIHEETNVQSSTNPTKENKENRVEDSKINQEETKVPEAKKETKKSVQSSKVIVLARRKKRVQLADNNASMTVIINAQSMSSSNNNARENSASKARTCKLSRSYKEVL